MHSQLVENGYESFQRRRRSGELTPSPYDNTRCTAKVVSGYNPRLFIADPDMHQPEDGGDRARPASGVARASTLDTVQR